MAGALAAARGLADCLRGAGKPLDLAVAAESLSGLDVDIRGAGPPEDATGRKLAAAAERLDLARLSIHGETLIECRPPQIAFGAVLAVPVAGRLPPGDRQPASRRWRNARRRRSQGAKRVADLFCGAGAFALRLAGQA